MIRLREARLRKGISQKELSKEIQVAQNTISNWETGVREPSLDMLIRMADYLDCSVDYLLGRTDCPQGYVKKAPPDLESAGLEQVVKTKDEPLTPEEIAELRRFLEQVKQQKD